MEEQDKMFEQIQKMFNDNPKSFTVIEEKIDLELQFKYFRRSKKLKKQNKSIDEVLLKVPLLYSADSRFEEKRDTLIHLASFEDVRSFRAIEAFWKEAGEQIKPWASIAYRESKMILESSLLDEKQILISTGLGGKGYKLRFFIVYIQEQNEAFSETQQKIIQNEAEIILNKNEGEIEYIKFDGELCSVLLLLPINISIKNTMQNIVTACNEFGNFISQNFIITNVKELSNLEIVEILAERSSAPISEEFDDFMDDDDEDYDDDED